MNATRSLGFKEEPYVYYSSCFFDDSLSLSVHSDELHMLPILPSRDWALNLNKISAGDRTYLK